MMIVTDLVGSKLSAFLAVEMAVEYSLTVGSYMFILVLQLGPTDQKGGGCS